LLFWVKRGIITRRVLGNIIAFYIILYYRKVFMKITLIYLAVISVLSIVVTVYDKIISKKGGYRIPEQTLLMLSAIGGSFAMLITMVLIRHKTKHIKFMAGIPLIIALQILFTFFIVRYMLMVG